MSLGADLELALGVDGHEPQMVGPERVQHEKRAARGGIGQRFRGSTLPLDRVSRRLAVQQCEPAVFPYAEARNRIVAAIAREQKPPIRREDHAGCTLEGVRRAVLPAYRLESPGAGATSDEAV